MMSGLSAAHWRRIAAAVLIVAALGAGLAWAVHELLETTEDEEKHVIGPPSRLAMKDGVAVLTLSEAERRNSGIETARPSPPPEWDSVVAYGTVLDAAPLSELGNQYRDAEMQAQIADAKLAVSRAAFERAKILHKDQQNISAAQLQAAEGGFEVDKAAASAARSRLLTLAASARQAWGNLLGEALIDRQPLVMRLIERHDYLVRVTLPSGAPGAIVATPPETVMTRLAGGAEIGLDFVAPATNADPRLQGISYLYRAVAEGGLLPGLHLRVLLPVKSDQRGVVVPEAAVVWLQGAAWIYLRTDPNTFIRREIIPERAGPNGGYVVAGLSPDGEIVVRGAQMLLSEEFRSQVPIED